MEKMKCFCADFFGTAVFLKRYQMKFLLPRRFSRIKQKCNLPAFTIL